MTLRHEKLQEALREAAAEFLAREANRQSLITVTGALVSEDGKRGYVANSRSNNISVIDLDKRTVAANIHVGIAPGLARVSPDGSTVVVSNRGDGTVSLIDAQHLRVRNTVPVCAQPEDIVILPDNSKAFVACAEACAEAFPLGGWSRLRPMRMPPCRRSPQGRSAHRAVCWHNVGRPFLDMLHVQATKNIGRRGLDPA